MKKLLAALFFLISVQSFAQTYVSGNITQNTVWTKAGSPYVLSGNVGVPSAYVLTVEPGVRIERYADNQILINGTLQMNGSEEDSIALYSNYASTIDTRSFIEFEKSMLTNSAIRFVSFQTAGIAAGNLRVGNEQDNNQTSPKNSGALRVSRSNLSNGYTFAAGYLSGASLLIDSSYVGAGQIINNRNYYSERIYISNSTIENSRELTGNGANGIHHFNCSIQNSTLDFLNDDSIAYHFDSCSLINSPVVSLFLSAGSIVFTHSTDVNSPLSAGTNLKISHSSFTVDNNANLLQFPTYSDNRYFLIGSSVSSDSSIYTGAGGTLDCFYFSGGDATPLADTIVHNTFKGFRNHISVAGFSTKGITVDYNNFLFDAATIYHIKNLTPKDFYALHDYFELENGKTIDDYLYDTNDDLTYGLIIYEPSSPVILPVKLISFTGSSKNDQIVLTWQTSDEINTSQFVIQQLQNGSYIDKGTVAAKGGTANTYSFALPAVSSGTIVYRLKIVDRNGKYTYSYSISVDLSLLTASLSVYPNPTVNYVLVTHATAGKASSLQLADMSGKIVKQMIVVEGDVQSKMIVTGIAKGRYTVIYRSGNSAVYKNLIVY